ncbi:MAG: glycoside hydrolase family 43 protein [Bacteroidales bacterium]|jgi:GH43 family beta-xylosidase|nr:glycoside hydrolase family 43 protein [Bacteroidales bacterium]
MKHCPKSYIYRGLKILGFLCLSFFVMACHSNKNESTSLVSQKQDVFTNPILPNGSQPWAILVDGVYYYMQEMVNELVLWKTDDLTDLRNAPREIIAIPSKQEFRHDLWGPKIHHINNKWYIYYEADDGDSDNHQIFVLENDSKDPFEGEFVSKGRISTDKNNNWAIHPNVFLNKGVLYMLWSGWETRRVSEEVACIYIAKMKNPWTLASERVQLSKPEYEWERQWINTDGSKTPYTIYVNEAPYFFANERTKELNIFYSASGTWTSFYATGQLIADYNCNLLNPKSWKKSPRPVFKQSIADSIFSIGSRCIVPSPDGKEQYLLYHARNVANDPPGNADSRSPRMQKINWKDDGSVYLGVPVPENVYLNKPSGTKLKSKHK